jgi:hypothetical protein
MVSIIQCIYKIIIETIIDNQNDPSSNVLCAEVASVWFIGQYQGRIQDLGLGGRE